MLGGKVPGLELLPFLVDDFRGVYGFFLLSIQLFEEIFQFVVRCHNLLL